MTHVRPLEGFRPAGLVRTVDTSCDGMEEGAGQKQGPKSSEEEGSSCRYRYEGDILEGIVEYLKIIKHIKKRDSN